MLEFDPTDKEEIAFELKKAVKKSGLSLTEISECLEKDYGDKISISALSHVIWCGTIRFQRALQILAVCGVKEAKIKR